MGSRPSCPHNGLVHPISTKVSYLPYLLHGFVSPFPRKGSRPSCPYHGFVTLNELHDLYGLLILVHLRRYVGQVGGEVLSRDAVVRPQHALG